MGDVVKKYQFISWWPGWKGFSLSWPWRIGTRYDVKDGKVLPVAFYLGFLRIRIAKQAIKELGG